MVPEPLPLVDVKVSDIQSIAKIIVVPEVLGAVIQQFPFKKTVGTILISYPDQHKESSSQQNQEFDEDEQLYGAMNYKQKYPTTEIPIQELVPGTLAIVVPHFSHIIVNNVLAQQLTNTLSTSIWITLAPCALENLISCSKLSLNLASYDGGLPKTVSLIPNLGPPHCFTGISAAINSLVTECPLISIALNAEGQPGFEKVTNSIQLEAAKIIGSFAYDDNENLQAHYAKNLSTRLRKLMANDDYGMYL